MYFVFFLKNIILIFFFFFFKQKTAYEMELRLEFRRVLFRSCHGPNLLCRGRYRQGPADRALQDRAAVRRRVLSRFAGGESRASETIGVPAMATGLDPGRRQNQLNAAADLAFASTPINAEPTTVHFGLVGPR